MRYLPNPHLIRQGRHSSTMLGTLIRLLSLGLLIGLLFMIESQAKAYVDPGSGLFTLQIIAASFAGGVFFLRQKLKKIFVRGNRQAASVEEAVSVRKPAQREMNAPNDPSNKKILA